MRLLALSIVLVTAPAVAAAQVSLTAQDRSTSASSESVAGLWDLNTEPFAPDFDPPTMIVDAQADDSDAAPDFGPYAGSASTEDPALPLLMPEGTSDASQTSTLSPSSMVASGDTEVVSDARALTAGEIALANAALNPPVDFFFGALSDLGSADSDFSVSFDVAAPTPYALQADLALSPLAGIVPQQTAGDASVSLTGPSGLVAAVAIDQTGFCDFAFPCETTADSIDVVGVLAPGSYTLTASVTSIAQGLCADIGVFTCGTPTSTGSFDLTLSLAAAPSEVPAAGAGGLVLLGGALSLLGGRVVRRRVGTLRAE